MNKLSVFVIFISLIFTLTNCDHDSHRYVSSLDVEDIKFYNVEDTSMTFMDTAFFKAIDKNTLNIRLKTIRFLGRDESDLIGVEAMVYKNNLLAIEIKVKDKDVDTYKIQWQEISFNLENVECNRKYIVEPCLTVIHEEGRGVQGLPPFEVYFDEHTNGRHPF